MVVCRPVFHIALSLHARAVRDCKTRVTSLAALRGASPTVVLHLVTPRAAPLQLTVRAFLLC